MSVYVHMTKMPMQWLILCKLRMFVFIIHDSDARSKGNGLPLGANACRSTLTGIATAKKQEGLSREGGCIAFVLWMRSKLWSSVFPASKPLPPREGMKLKASERLACLSSHLWLSSYPSGAVLVAAVSKTWWWQTCFQGSAQYCLQGGSSPPPCFQEQNSANLNGVGDESWTKVEWATQAEVYINFHHQHHFSDKPYL